MKCSNIILSYNWWNKYIEVRCELQCEKTTVNLYKSYLKAYPFLSKPAKKLRPIDIEEFKKSRVLKGNANKSINEFITFLKSAFKWGVDNEYVNKNPVEKIEKLPKQKKQEVEFLTEAEIKIFLEAISDYPIEKQTALYVSLYTGVRIGELLAIKWSDIDFEQGTLSINEQYYKGKIKELKTATSYRTVTLHDNVVKKLQEYKNSLTILERRVFSGNTKYRTWNRAKFIEDYFKPAIQATGKDYGIHCLRHTYASMLIAQGYNCKFIQQQLGHADISITMNIYGHLMPKYKEEARHSFKPIETKYEQKMSNEDKKDGKNTDI